MPTSLQGAVLYVTAEEAVEYLAHHVGGKFQARNIVIDAMHSGDLITTADYAWVIESADPTADWEEIISGAALFAENVEFPPDYWLASYQWPSETRHWRWKTGNFLLNRNEEPYDMFLGDALGNVQFEQQQVERLIGSSSRAGVGGRKFDKEKWAEFWINILRETSGSDFRWDKFRSKNALKTFMLDHCNEDLFADSSVGYAVDLAWKMLVEKAAQEREVWGDK